MKSYYENGSTHIDHHKEININKGITQENLNKLIDVFFNDYEEAQIVPTNNDSEAVNRSNQSSEKTISGTHSDIVETSEIHRDEDVHTVQRDADCSEELKYDAPREALKEFLTEDWLEELRSNKRYTVGWMNAFVDALISSQYGKEIARDWAVEVREKKNAIMGNVLGLLVDAGVLKGSYNAIAEKVNLMEKPRTFAKYMGKGKKQPYALCVREYVTNHG